ncbi:BA75_05126T0 [Komagataella pastoris]|uniref:Crossover junction endonuclease MUS81 n=1 Tax=Komagataella pastoris TaxID=4922 RepID=A0A1B2JHV4_PICPA|nr:BA75_05126T0 [Komagataella pastoris]
MDLPSDLKHLFLKWLEEDCIVQIQLGSKRALQLTRAIENLKRTDEAINNVNKLKSVRYIGPKITEFLNKKLLKYCNDNGYRTPDWCKTAETTTSSRKPTSHKVTKPSASTSVSGVPPGGRSKGKRKYVPAKNSSAYAILISLLVNDSAQTGVQKSTVIAVASKYCERSFTTNPATGQFYSAWNSIKTLINHELVVESTTKRPALYYLTDEGKLLATTLVQEMPEHQRPQIDGYDEDYDARQSTPTAYFASCGYQEWSNFTIKMIIDNREIRSQTERDFFQNKMSDANVPIEIRPLPVGDVLWVARSEAGEEVVLDTIVERKRLDDLVASIQDGRFLEQKSRLKETKLKNIIYITEEFTSTNLGQMAGAVQTSLSMIMTNFQFRLHRTKDADATCKFLSILHRSVCNRFQNKPIICINAMKLDDNSLLAFQDSLMKFRKEMDKDGSYIYINYSIFHSIFGKSSLVSLKETYIKMLMTTKGVSLEKAIQIQKHYPTPQSLIKAFRESKDPKLLSQHFKQEIITHKKVTAILSEKIFQTWGI